MCNNVLQNYKLVFFYKTYKTCILDELPMGVGSDSGGALYYEYLQSYAVNLYKTQVRTL